VKQHPKLLTLSTYPDFANVLKRELIKGNLEALYTRFGTPKPEQKPNVRLVFSDLNLDSL